MMTNQLTGGVWISSTMLGELKGKGFGLAGGLILEPSPLDHSASAGELFWGGVAGTQWWISPKANVAGVMMTQRQMAFFHPFAFEFKRLAYEAVKRKR
jgi:CubicO group peptidase (beta-lactamase class C family)